MENKTYGQTDEVRGLSCTVYAIQMGCVAYTLVFTVVSPRLNENRITKSDIDHMIRRGLSAVHSA